MKKKNATEEEKKLKKKLKILKCCMYIHICVAKKDKNQEKNPN